MKQNTAIGSILLLIIAMISCQSGQDIEYARYYSLGDRLYQTHCKNCHGAHGEGLQALIPPLTDTVFIKKNIHLMPCLVQNGYKGKIIISKKEFEGQMPANDLAPNEITYVLTYVTNAFGNHIGAMKVETVSVDLAKCK